MLLKVLDRNKENAKYIEAVEVIEEGLADDVRLSFVTNAENQIDTEGYVIRDHLEFVIKEVARKKIDKIVTAVLNVEEIEGKTFVQFESKEKTLQEFLATVMAGTGWGFQCPPDGKRRTIRGEGKSAYELIKQAVKVYGVKMRLAMDVKKLVFEYPQPLPPPQLLAEEIGAEKIEPEEHSYDFVTRLYPVGKDGLTIADINDGLPYVENFTYSKKIKSKVWKDERYTNMTSLKEDAIQKLERLARPHVTYKATLLRTASLGESFEIIFDDGTTSGPVELVKCVTNFDNMNDSYCELESKRVADDDSFRDDLDALSYESSEIKEKLAEEQAKGEELKLALTRISADYVSSTFLQANYTETKELVAKYATIASMNAEIANVRNLVATDITAATADIGTIKARFAQLNNLIAGTTSADVATAIHLKADNTVIDNAVIDTILARNANIRNLAAGQISTSAVNIVSDDGSMIITDGTIQIKDNTQAVRVQLGKTATGDFSMHLFDNAGNVIFSPTGITENSIKQPIIRNDMVTADANIDASKLNINSLFNVINNDGTNSIKTSTLLFDDKGQKFDVVFNNLENDVTANTTKVTAVEGSVQTLVNKTNHLNSGLSAHEIEIGKIKSSVTNIQSLIDDKEIIVDAMPPLARDKLWLDISGKPYFLKKYDRTELKWLDIGLSPDEIESKLNETKQTLQTSITQSEDNILSVVSNTTYTRQETDEKINVQASSLKQTENEFNFQFTQMQSYIENVEGQQIAQRENLEKYIRFVNGTIEIGEVGNTLTLKIANDKIYFLDGDSEVAYFSNQKLYVTDGEFLNSLQLGKFGFLPRENGNLRFKKIKE